MAAVILEPVTGANGVLAPSPGYLRSIREVCDRYGILLVFDEVMTGFGRTGRWFAGEHWGVVPDIMTTAKGISSGYVPLGAMVVGRRLRDWLQDHEFAGGLTTCGHPLACAAGVATIGAIRGQGLVDHAAALGDVLAVALPGLAADHASIGEVRGLGLLWGLELVRDRVTREPLVPFNAMDRGLYLFTHDNVVLVAPPLIISREELAEGLAILDEVLGVADAAAASL